tara:strand:- start:1439 stop:2107 length:669 start_codon:yes stop_codon:yes gene_type:complete
MKISSDTLTVLQNFATINNGIQVKPGSRLQTISSGKTLLASAAITESFDVPFCIYDLSQFLGTLSLFDSPDIDFGENAMTISEGSTNLKYVYADPNTIITVPEKRLECDGDIVFDIEAADMSKLSKAANVLNLPNFVITKHGDDLVASATDVKNSTSNNFRINVEAVAVPDNEFKMVMRFDNLRLLSDDYRVKISSKGISHFDGHRAEYFVAVEQNDSEFNN